ESGRRLHRRQRRLPQLSGNQGARQFRRVSRDTRQPGSVTAPALSSRWISQRLSSERKRPAGASRPASPPPARHQRRARSARREGRIHSTADRFPEGDTIMRWTQFLKTLLTRPVRRARAVPKRSVSRRLALEHLEARDVPSISFQAAGNYYTGGSSNQSVATGDFNHDGATDLAKVNPNNSTVAVLLG